MVPPAAVEVTDQSPEALSRGAPYRAPLGRSGPGYGVVVVPLPAWRRWRWAARGAATRARASLRVFAGSVHLLADPRADAGAACRPRPSRRRLSQLRESAREARQRELACALQVRRCAGSGRSTCTSGRCGGDVLPGRRCSVGEEASTAITVAATAHAAVTISQRRMRGARARALPRRLWGDEGASTRGDRRVRPDGELRGRPGRRAEAWSDGGSRAGPRRPAGGTPGEEGAGVPEPVRPRRPFRPGRGRLRGRDSRPGPPPRRGVLRRRRPVGGFRPRPRSPRNERAIRRPPGTAPTPAGIVGAGHVDEDRRARRLAAAAPGTMFACPGSRSPLRRLHGAQQVTMFSQVDGPPFERGITWSTVRLPRSWPQYWQVQRSRANTARRVILRRWASRGIRT